jgi:ribosome biogenesis GTPase
MISNSTGLADFGWNAFFASQLDLDETTPLIAARVMAVHRDRIRVAGPAIDTLIAPYVAHDDDIETAATVGDWLLLDAATLQPRRLLERRSLFKRRAAGTGRRPQLIAANVDTLFIVSSCNQDFNLARLERYLALASEAEVTPVVVLTKVDLTDTPEDFARTAARLLPGLLVEMVDSRDPLGVACLEPWCARGQTVALVGSSGVGKSTLINTLSGTSEIATQGIRGDDDKGRHTTSGRALHRLPAGGWLVDTPGMRELQLADAHSGVEDVFADIVALASHCRFSDCRHDGEPGCAVRSAIESGALDAVRVGRWQKLAAEEARNTQSLAERRARDRSFGRLARDAMKGKRWRRGE